MGDRGNVRVQQDNGDAVYIYSHWAGSELPELVQEALRRRARWDDPSYLTRIIYDTCVGTDFGTETGWGLTTYEMDENHPTVEVYPNDELVRYGEFEWTFEDFIALAEIPRR